VSLVVASEASVSLVVASEASVLLVVKKENPFLKTLLYAILIAGVITCLIPYLWMIITSLKPSGEVFAGNWLPKKPTLDNYSMLFQISNFVLYYWNSLVIAFFTVGLGLFFDSLAGFAFAKFRFPFRDQLFWIILITLMVPAQITLIPSYLVLTWLGLTNKLTGIIIGGIASAFGIFLCRQYMSQVIPDDLVDAAKIDGCSPFQIYLKVALPLARPVLGALAIFRFLASWNNYMWPLIVLQDRDKFTLPVGIALITGRHGIPIWAVQMAGSFLATLPINNFFHLMQKQIISGITIVSVKE
jgi:multiple sugar transport system permease protein